jgi:hypothetical protein
MMADEEGLIHVRAIQGLNVRENEHRVQLNEFDPRHPGGQAWVAGPKPVLVFETPTVLQRIREGRIEKVGASEAKKAETERRKAAEDAGALGNTDARVTEILQRESTLSNREQSLSAEQAKLDADRAELQRQMDAFAKQQKGTNK